ncbi:NADP-dependent oxidoreductase domain-containing protein [Lipomyces kononenkoae]|uniref:NADP-dependent oxidoreductase domain-containing protein n=1 Tax=Lipomyces kononenkoae TaxID=34357 RepID=A0ACC3SZP4_LIPKO
MSRPGVGIMKPKSLLGYHRILSQSAGVRVSPLCLGTMNFGEAWEHFMGVCKKDAAFEILDYFFEMGGNFIDTANGYQAEESEEWLGEWMASRKNRDQLVIATKYTGIYPSGKGGEYIKSNFLGNHSKSMYLSLEASLKKLQTSYIDIFYVHWWDFSTSIPELMQSLNRMVDAGKVLYLGISDTPAWVVSKANEYARAHSLTQFSIYQGKWSASVRDFERDILPMCESEGMALAPWGALGQGIFKSAKQRQSDDGRKGRPPTEQDIKVSETLEVIAAKKGTTIASVALSYIMHKAPYVYPIVGVRKLEQLKGNIDSLSVELSDEDIDEIESAYPFDVGFPMTMLFGLHDPSYYKSRMTTKDVNLIKNFVSLDAVEKVRPIHRYKIDD